MNEKESHEHGVHRGWTIQGSEVVTDLPVGYGHASMLRAARIDPFGAAQWEIACELELSDGLHIPLTIDVATAATLGQTLIAEAAISRKHSNDEYDAQMPRYQPPRNGEDADDEIPF